MGITKKDSQLLFYARRDMCVDFDQTLMLGRLYLYATRQEIETFSALYGSSQNVASVTFPDEYSESLFKILGASRIESLDYSDYEKASIIHDLNQPIPANVHSQFSCVVDGGTIEHVFNFPVAIKNCMEALKVGGHYIGITPTNNQMGHGFYQFSPELYYRIFSEENGFRVKKMIVRQGETEGDWYEVSDPAMVGSRVIMVNNLPVTLMVIAEKIAEREIFKVPPYQSDYTTSWSMNQQVNQQRKSLIKQIYQKVVPKRLRSIFRNLYDIYNTEKMDTQYLGTLNAEHYKKITI